MVVEDILNGKRLKIGPRYARAVLRYVDMADDMFTVDQDEEAREWVRGQLLALASENDLKWLPNWIEGPVENCVINLAVDLSWELTHSRRLRKALVASSSE